MHKMDKDFIEDSLETNLFLSGQRNAAAWQRFTEIILRCFEVTDKPGRAHTSDAAGASEFAVHPSGGNRNSSASCSPRLLDCVRGLQHDISVAGRMRHALKRK
jgi:hypothetical protein